MDDRTAFIRKISSAPQDDVARLVFADWLQEHGEDDWASLFGFNVTAHNTHAAAINGAKDVKKMQNYYKKYARAF